MTYPNLPIVEVEWIDSTMLGSGGWVKLDRNDLLDADDVMYFSVGYVLKEDDDLLTLALSVDLEAEEQAMAILSIPKVAIRHRRTIRNSRQTLGP